MKVAEMKVKLAKHQAYYDVKFIEYTQMDKSAARSLKRYSRLLTLSNLITALIIELNTEKMVEVFTDDAEELLKGLSEKRKRKIEQGAKNGGIAKNNSALISEDTKAQPHDTLNEIAEMSGSKKGGIS